MRTLSDILEEKVYSAVNYLLALKIKPTLKYGKVTDIDEEAIDRLKNELGVEGVILDVDDTLRKDMRNIPMVNKAWLEKLKQSFKVIVVSNGMDRRISDYFSELEVGYIEFAHKPLKMNFEKACKRLGISPEKVLVVGDSLFSDILGGNRMNMKTALIESCDDTKSEEDFSK